MDEDAVSSWRKIWIIPAICIRKISRRSTFPLLSPCERNLSPKFRGNYRVVGRFIGDQTPATTTAKCKRSDFPSLEEKESAFPRPSAWMARGGGRVIRFPPVHRTSFSFCRTISSPSMLITFPLRVMLIDSNRRPPPTPSPPRAIFHDDNENHGSRRKRG